MRSVKLIGSALVAAQFWVPSVAFAQPKSSQDRGAVLVDDHILRVVGVPQEYKDKDGLAPGWVVAIEARDKGGKLISRAGAAVTGCEPNQLGPKMGRMFILNGKVNYWTPNGDRVADLLAKAACAEVPKRKQ